MLTALLLTLAGSQVALSPDCGYDRDAMLSLDRTAFDQSPVGWRSIGEVEGCEIVAADLIRDYRYERRDNTSILYWHEGQLRAFGGQTNEAIDLLMLAYKPPEWDADFGFNHYASGTIAFLLRDRDWLRASIENLKAVPRPEGEIEGSWPPNLPVLEAMERCWNQTYRKAYKSASCYAPQASSSTSQ